MPLFLILRRSVVRPFLDCRNRRNPHRTASARSVAAPVGLLDRNCTINDKFLLQRAGQTFFSCYPEPARARPQVAAVNFASLVVLLAARPFVRARWLSPAASVRQGWVAVPGCLRLPRASSPKPVNGLRSRYAARFLLAPRSYEQVRWRSAAASVRADRYADD